MKISASVRNSRREHQATVSTNEHARAISIPPKEAGSGSSANGGELLFLALATCYCNDIYREATKRGIAVERVEVDVVGEFGGPGDPAANVTYRARVVAAAPEPDILDLMRHTDTVAEIQNTLRQGMPVTLAKVEAVSSQHAAPRR